MSQNCWVICGGPSGEKYVDTNDDVIAVNKDIFRYPTAKYALTMDNRFIMWEVDGKGREMPKRPTKVFIANLDSPHVVFGKSMTDMRWGMSYNLYHYDMIIKSYRSGGGFGWKWNEFRSGCNSGFCAVQFALLMGYKNIHLVGIDLCKMGEKTHHHEGYEKSRDNFQKSLNRFKDYFIDGVKGYKNFFPNQTLINHSPVSPLKEYLGYEPY